MMDLSKLTEAEREDLEKQLRAEREKKQKLIDGNKKAFEELRQEAVVQVYHSLISASESLVAAKKAAFEKFIPVIELKEELYGVKDSQRSHTWTSSDGNVRLKMGSNYVDRWGDATKAGLAKVFDWLDGRRDDDKQDFSELIRDLITTGDTGSLDTRKVLTLEKHAISSKDNELVAAVSLIKEGHWLDYSSTSIQLEVKDEHQRFRTVPLNIAQA